MVAVRIVRVAKRVLLVFGTRPEAIKMAPVAHECLRRTKEIELIICLTGQHDELLTQVVSYFEIQSDINLEVMRHGQTPGEVIARCLNGLDKVIAERQPSCVIAQGDTSTAVAAGLATFYRRVPFVHVEAGLRTKNLLSPWPEELNRRIVSLATSLHCTPTLQAANHLLLEGHSPSSVHVTGNTVIDALLWTLERERSNQHYWEDKYGKHIQRRMVLITSHRSENIGQGISNICRAVACLAEAFPSVDFIYLLHPNPLAMGPIRQRLTGIPNVHLIPPPPYPEFVWLMDRAVLMLTDSGGIQEEAPTLRKPVLVMRDTTERPEAVTCGSALLVGTDERAIVNHTTNMLNDADLYRRHQANGNPFGDGLAAKRIVELVLSKAW